jgi:hypothetical protein
MEAPSSLPSHNQYMLTSKEVTALSNTLRDPDIGLRTGTHYINFRPHPYTFTGTDLVRWLTNHDIVINKMDAMMVGSQLLSMHQITAAGGKSISKSIPNKKDFPNDRFSSEIFLDERSALYCLAENSYTNQPRRAGQKLARADSSIFSKGSWNGFKMGRKKLKKKLSKRERITVVDIGATHSARKATKKLSKIVQRRRTMEQFAQGQTALEMAVDQGFDYTEVLIPPHVPIYGTSEGSIYRERAINEDDPPKYQFHYDIASTRKSSTRSSANITVPSTNKKMSNRVLFYMMGETDLAKAQAKTAAMHAAVKLEEEYKGESKSGSDQSERGIGVGVGVGANAQVRRSSLALDKLTERANQAMKGT